MQEEPSDLTTLFLRISAEMDIASNRLCAAEKCLVKVSQINGDVIITSDLLTLFREPFH